MILGKMLVKDRHSPPFPKGGSERSSRGDFFALPQIMGILNLTPDSFYQGSRVSLAEVVDRAAQMVEDGADILDLGGESTRPGADAVGVEEELERVLPALLAIKKALPQTPISIDTQKPQVMHEVMAIGVQLINDVNALQAPGALELMTGQSLDICLMHRQGSAKDMQNLPKYGNILHEIKDFFSQRLAACAKAGIAKSQILLDPGIGFGKSLNHNLILINRLSYFKQLGCRLLFGASRKSMLGEILHCQPKDRMIGSVTLAVLAAERGVDVLRVHDVKATREALTVAAAVAQEAIANG